MRYEAPVTVNELANLLSSNDGIVKILAGGTDILVQMRSGAIEPDLLVDIKGIDAMNIITKNKDGYQIGASVSCAALNENVELKQDYAGVCEGAGLIGSAQVQGRATMVGNLCNASPAADSVPCLVAVGATVTVVGNDGATRQTAVENIPQSPGLTSLGKHEFISSINLPKKPINTGDAYLRFIPRSEMDIAVVGCAVCITLDDEGVCTDAKLFLGAVAEKIIIVKDAVKAMVGTMLDDEVVDNLEKSASKACSPINDKRGTIEFRTKVAGVLAKRAAIIAYKRAMNKMKQ